MDFRPWDALAHFTIPDTPSPAIAKSGNGHTNPPLSENRPLL